MNNIKSQSKVSAKKKNKVPSGYSTDAKFQWATVDFGEKAADWAELATQYMEFCSKSRGGAYGPKLHGISIFIRRYIAAHGLWDPAAILIGKREENLPVILGDSKPALYPIKMGSIVFKNRIIEFLDWIIENDPRKRFGTWDDGQFLKRKDCRNPFSKGDFAGIPKFLETDKTPLPWKILCDLREKLVPGLHFSDWEWAIKLRGVNGGTQSGDWFEVTDREIIKLIDLKPGDSGYDPDLVMRRRMAPVYTASGYAKEKWDRITKKSYTVKREIVEIWSPMRTLAIYTKLEICARTFQVRTLNSGETDLERVELVDNIIDGKPHPKFVWRANPHRDRLLKKLSEHERKQVLGSLGVFRSFTDRFAEDRLTGLFFTSNKTGDIGKDPASRGYFMPWQNDTLLRWLIKGRNWQEKYNPVEGPVRWEVGTHRHYGYKINPADLKSFPPTCFLFRDASALNPPAISASSQRWTKDDHALPISKQALDKAWAKLLIAYQRELKAQGVKCGGRPIDFIKKYHKKESGATTRHPLHSLRVSLISAWAMEGNVPLAVLQKIAGHACLKMTLHYTKINESFANNELRKAIEKLDRDKNEHYINWLANASVSEISSRLVPLDDASMRTVMDEDPARRSPYAWLLVHDGWCLAGGNTTPSVGANHKMPGCYNGGKLLAGSGTKSMDIHEAIPPRKCAECRCRWLVTGPSFLEALRAKFDSKGRILGELEGLKKLTEEKLNGIKDARYDTQKLGLPFDDKELIRTQTLLERQEVDAMRALDEVSSVAYVVGRCLEVLETQKQDASAAQQLLSLGTSADVKVAIEGLDSELLAVSGICMDAEIYPELEGDATSAIYRRSQLFDQLLSREKGQIPLMTFDRALQLKIGNKYTEQIIIAQEAQLTFAKKTVPQGATAILNIAIFAAEEALKRKERIPVYLREALKVADAQLCLSANGRQALLK